MATLQNIRKRGPVVATVIGLALMAFILGDFLNSGASLFTGSRTEVAEIAGQSVNIKEYQNKMDELTNLYKQQYGGSLDEAMVDRVRNDVWTQLIRTYIMQKEYASTGVSVHSDELFDMVQGKNVSPTIRNLFTNQETGIFDPQSVTNFLQNMKYDRTGQSQAQWLYVENELLDQRMYQKYQNLVSKGLYITKAQAQAEIDLRAKSYNLNFIEKNISEISDEDITVTDSDLKAYYKANKEDFKQESSRDISYVTYDVSPSAEDLNKAQASLEDMKEEFAATENSVQYVNANSDVVYDYSNYRAGELTAEIDGFMFTEEVGAVYGPYPDAGSFKLSKLVLRSLIPDSVEARHILLQPSQTVSIEQVKATADSLVAVINGGADFAQLAKDNSTDGSASKGGDLGWFTEGRMVQPFNDACFQGTVGELQVVETQFGVHIIEVTAKGAGVEKVQVATIEHVVEPGSQTFSGVYAVATNFSTSVENEEAFNKALGENKLIKRVANNIGEMDFNISGLEQPRDLVSWAYKADQGDVSGVFELGNRFIVATLSKIRKEGYASFKEVKEQISFSVKQEKKGELLAKQVQEALSGVSDINALAGKLNTQVKTASNVSFNAYSIPGASNEPKLLGVVAVSEKDKLSAPIVGKTSVFVVLVTDIIENQATGNLTAEKQRLSRTIAGRAGYQAYEALREAADVKDGRSKFY